MKDNKCIFVITLHKSEIDNYEYVSFSRLCKMFGQKYDILINTYKELDLTEYSVIAKKYNTELIINYYDKEYFDNIWGYSLIVTDVMLYKKLSNYKYIFIYHLDNYIFKNELEYWINKDYDQCECVAVASTISGGYRFWYNGEGLRKTSRFLRLFDEEQENFCNFKTQLLTLNLFNKTQSPLSKDWILYKCGEDVYYTDHISGGKVREDMLQFGWTTNILNSFDVTDKYGLPMMIHNFEKGHDWILQTIGDPDKDPEACINKTYY